MKKSSKIVFLLTGLLGIGILFFVVLYFSANTFINSETVKKKVNAYFLQKTGGSIAFQASDIHLFPFPYIDFRQVHISIPHKADGLIYSLNVYPDIWSLLRGNVQFSKLILESPRFTVALSEDKEKTSLEEIEEKISAVVRDMTSIAPRSFLTIKKGKLDLTKEDRIVFSFDKIQARINTSGKSLSISLTCTSDIWDALSFNSSLDAEDLKNRGSMEIKHLRPHAVFTQLSPKTGLHFGDTDATVSVNFQTLGLRQIQAKIESSLPSLTISREGNNVTMTDLSIDGDIEIKKEQVSVLLSELEITDPKLRISGKYTLDRISGIVKLDLEGKSIEVNSTRKSVLTLGGNIPVIKNIFDIVRGGEIPVLHFSSGGKSFSELGKLGNMRISGQIQKGDISIPAKDLMFHNVTGNVVIEKGILEGENIEASLENQRGSHGQLRVGLKGENAPFHLDMRVKADLAQLPSLLTQKNLISNKAVLREMNRLSETRGTSSGRLILGDRLDEIDIVFDVSEMNLAARHELIPFPLALTGGQVFFNEKILKVTGVHGSIGNSSFSGLTGKINLDDSAFIEITYGRFTLNTDEIYPWITSFRNIKPVLKDVPSMHGTIEVSALTMKGLLHQPKDWRFIVNGEARKLALDAVFLPGKAEDMSGAFTITQDELNLKNIRAKMIDSELSLSGTFRAFPADIDNVTMSLQGEIGPKVASWISSFIKLPPELMPRAPFLVSDTNLAWVKDKKTTFSGRILFGKGTETSFTLTKTPDELSVRDITIRDDNSAVTAGFLLNRKTIDMVFNGNLSADTINTIFAQQRVLDSSLKGDFSAHIMLNDPIQSTVDGVIEGKNLRVPWEYDIPLAVQNFTLKTEKNHIFVNNAEIVLGKDKFTFNGAVDTAQKAAAVDMDIATDGFDYEELENIFRKKKHTQDKKEAGFFEKFPIKGSLRIQSGFLTYRQFTWSPLHADISFDDKSIHIRAKKAVLCGISTTGDIDITPQSAEINVALSANNLDLQPTILCISDKKVDITGRFEMKAGLKAKGKLDTIAKSLNGPFTLSAKDGKIVKEQTINKTLDLVNETEHFKGQLPDLDRKSIDYRLFTMQGTLDGQRVILEEGILDTPGFEMFAEGELLLREKSLDLNALVAPLDVGQQIVAKVPVLGHITGGHLVSIPVKIRGTIYDPKVTFLSPSAIGSAFLGIIKRTIKLPITVIEPVLPKKTE